MKKERGIMLVLFIIVVILSCYVLYGFVSNTMKLKSCYLYEGHLNQGGWEGAIEDWAVISPYIGIYNPNEISFEPFLLEYYIICEGEFIHYGYFQKTSGNELTSLHTQYSLFYDDIRLNSTAVDENTWSRIQDNSAEWVIQGRLVTYEMEDYYFRIEQNGFWQYEP